jgi:hypothetical protein
VLRQVERARNLGTMFMYWRGDHARPVWERTLAALERMAAASSTSSARKAGRRRQAVAKA